MLYDPKWGTKSEASLVLIKARQFIQRADCWTQHAWARDAGGQSVDSLSDKATSFCLHGALVRAAGGFYTPSREEAYILLREAAGNPKGFPGSWNDTHTHAEILSAFDRAIEAAALTARQGA